MELQEQLELFEEDDFYSPFIIIGVREQLKKCLDNDEMGELEPGMNFGIYNFLK